MKLTFTRPAQRDFHAVWTYLVEKASVAIADAIVGDIELACRNLAEQPGMGRKRADLTSRPLMFWPVRDYFVIYYVRQNTLFVARVLHAKRDIRGELD